jgi:hypothetical protein
VTTANRATRLGYGYNPGLPENVSAAWGARAIITSEGGIDLVHDRQSVIGPVGLGLKITSALDTGVADRWMGAATALLAAGVMSPRQPAEFVLARLDGVIVKGNTLGSGGYLYVCAYPDSPARGTLAWARAEHDRLTQEHGTVITGPGFAAMQEVIRRIKRPVFAADELVLVEREGALIRTGRFEREVTDAYGMPIGIASVTLREPYPPGRAQGQTVNTPLVMVTSAAPVAAADGEEAAQR